MQFDANDGAVVRIISAGLTNRPAIENLTALARTEGTMDDIQLETLRAELGLDDDANFDAVLSAIRDLMSAKASAEPDPTQFVPMAEFEQVVAEANSHKRGLREEQAKAHVEENVRAGKMAPFLRSRAVGPLPGRHGQVRRIRRQDPPPMPAALYIPNRGQGFFSSFAGAPFGRAPPLRPPRAT